MISYLKHRLCSHTDPLLVYLAKKTPTAPFPFTALPSFLRSERIIDAQWSENARKDTENSKSDNLTAYCIEISYSLRLERFVVYRTGEVTGANPVLPTEALQNFAGPCFMSRYPGSWNGREAFGGLSDIYRASSHGGCPNDSWRLSGYSMCS